MSRDHKHAPDLGLATINLQTNFEVSNYTHYEDMRNGAKCTNWGSLGSSGSLKVIGRPRSNFRDILGLRKLSSGVVCMIPYLAILVEHRLVTDSHGHRQTQARSIYRASVSSRGKN